MTRPLTQVRWERFTQRPLFALALAFAVAYAVPIVSPDAGPEVVDVCLTVEWVVWGAFAVDYVVRLDSRSDAGSSCGRTGWIWRRCCCR